jgi:hypothetical protein
MWRCDFDFDAIDSLNDELEKMNEGKKGAQYYYYNSFVLLSYVKAYFHMTYRQIEDIVRAHIRKKRSTIHSRLQYYISRHVNKLDIKINERLLIMIGDCHDT